MRRWISLALLLGVLFFWGLAIIGMSPPALVQAKWYSTYDMVMHFFSEHCHQQGTRCFWWGGYPMAVCGRCLGIYWGAGYAYLREWAGQAPTWRQGTIILFLSLCDKIVEIFWGLPVFLQPCGNFIRFVSGVLAGFSIFILFFTSIKGLNRMLIKRLSTLSLVALILGASGFFHVLPVSQFAQALSKTESVNQALKLPAGSAVLLTLLQSIDANEVSVGQQVNAQVLQDVKINNTTLIKAGTLATAQVTKADKNGMIGQAAELIVADFYTTAVDGSRVPLMATISQDGKDKMAVSVIGGVICLFPLLIKGGKAIIPAGTQKTVYTSADVMVTP